MKTTQLWNGVRLVNSTGKRIHITWKVLPDGTKMALLMGEGPSRLSGAQELGFFSAIAAAAPALFSMAKKMAPGLMSQAGKLVGNLLPGAAGKMLQSVISPAASQAQKAIAQAGTPGAAIPQPSLKIPAAAMMRYQQPIKAVRHLSPSASIPKGYTKVTPVMKVDEGAFLD